jgi:hypothetical protein
VNTFTKSHHYPDAGTLLAQYDLSESLRIGINDGLESLLSALEQEPGMSDTGSRRALDDIHHDLQRLQTIADYRRRYPEISEVAIERPLFVLGLPRCGTSILQGLMSADPEVRTPLMWEVATPDPPPEAASFDDDPRIAAFDAFVEREFSGPFADLLAAHPIGARMPQECGSFMTTSFLSSNPVMSYRVPSYYRWFLQADKSFRYEVHKMWLQHLSWHNRRKHWVLKIQEHMYSLPELLSVYPDAILVQPHRDPVEVVPSISRLIELLRGFAFDSIDRVALGREMLRLWNDGQVRMMAYRAAHPELSIHDLRYADLVADPVAAVSGIYRHAGWTFTVEAEAGVKRWLAANPSGKHGRHRYQLEDFGLTPAMVRDAYADYIEAYRDYL